MITVLWLITLSATNAFCATDSTLPNIQLNSDTALSSEGYFVISWDATEMLIDRAGELFLQQSANADFSSLHEISIGEQGSITLTGFSDGEYYFRLASAQTFSSSITVEVKHHDLGQALIFFMMGLLLFIILTVVIVLGNRSTGVTA